MANERAQDEADRIVRMEVEKLVQLGLLVNLSGDRVQFTERGMQLFDKLTAQTWS